MIYQNLRDRLILALAMLAACSLWQCVTHIEPSPAMSAYTINDGRQAEPDTCRPPACYPDPKPPMPPQ